MASHGEITRLLQQRDERSLEKLFPIVYDELKMLAGQIFKGEFRKDHTLQPTALVHEAYMRLMGELDGISWQNRAHFFGIAARSMRQILVGHARAHRADKRGGGQTVIALDDAISYLSTQSIEIVSLSEALDRLEELDPRQAQIVELRFFGGLSVEEAAEVLDVSPSTIKREWSMARVWLYRELTHDG
jgi:RNA polymerase sigma-70 factor, ECF subfamily